jgi:hypothetical protein
LKKVKFLGPNPEVVVVPVSGPQVQVERGKTVEVSDELAAELIAGGSFEPAGKSTSKSRKSKPAEEE